MSSIKFRRNVITKETKQEMIQDYVNGVPVEQITKKNKVSKPTLYRYLKQENETEETNATEETS